MAFTHALSTNRYGEGDLIVSTSAANGTHTTLAGAMADAVSGQTIFLRDSVTENVTLTAGVNITAWTGGTLNTPTITGTLTMTTAGTCNISGIKLTTNSAAILAITGSAASIVNLNNCYLNCSNSSGITYSTSSGSAALNITNCMGNLGTTGINLFAMSSAGGMTVANSIFQNSGGSSTANTVSAGIINSLSSQFSNPVTFSGTAAGTWSNTFIFTSTQNVTSLTLGASGTQSILQCLFDGGSASAISISTTATIIGCTVTSSNTNAITGAGTINYSGITFGGTSTTINTTTQTITGTLQGSKNTAPSVGFLGESISSTASAVATTANVAKTITSISLTPGVWDVSAFAGCVPTGGTQLTQILQVGISTTDNTITGTLGIEFHQFNIAVGSSTISGAVPQYRVTLTATTTYYLVVANFYTSTTCPTNGRISATRVG